LGLLPEKTFQCNSVEMTAIMPSMHVCQAATAVTH
jgi:hypothetical protein